MTIICYKKGKFVADGMEVHGDFITSLDIKKIKVAKPDDKWSILENPIVAFAACGTSSSEYTIEYLLKQGIYLNKLYNNVCNDEFAAICIDNKGNSYTIESSKEGDTFKFILVDIKPMEIPVAVGMGSMVAIANMSKQAGHSAYDAVEFNCLNFTSCGGTIQEVDIKSIIEKLEA